MTKKTTVAAELKALGSEMTSAFKQMKSSKEFNDLEKQIATSVRSVSASLIKSLQAAQKSQEATRLKKRVGRVVTLGKAAGKEQATKAAKVGLKKFHKAFTKLSKKLHKN